MKLAIIACLLLVVGLATPSWLLANAPDDDTAGPRQKPLSRQYLAADSSGHGNHGIIQGTPGMGVPGHEGTAFSFLRGKSWVQVASSPSLNPETRDFLVSAWIHFNDVPGRDETYDIARKGVAHTPEGELKLEIVDPGGVRCTAKDSARKEARVTNDLVDVSDGQWHYVACARTGSVLSVLADEILVSKKVKLGSVGNTMPLAIGSKYGWEDQSDGRVDEVSVVVSDSPADPRRDVDARSAIRKLQRQPPVASWHLDETPYAS